MSETQVTAEEMTQSLTGFDEIAIQKHFEMDVYLDAETKPVLMVRAMVFIHKTREGSTPQDAKQYAMSLPLSAVMEYFAEADDEPMPDEPVTEAGKDSEPSA